MSKRWRRPKDPDEVLDYRIDWLGDASDPGELYGLDDPIESSVWVLPAGISNEADSHDDGTVTIRFSGGADGMTYECLNRITLESGQVFDQTAFLKVKAR